MSRYFRKAGHELRDRGASAVEYGLMVAAIAAVIVAVVFGLGGLVRDTFSNTCQEITDSAPDGSAVPADADCDGGDEAPEGE